MRIALVVPSIVQYSIQLANALSSTHTVQFITTSCGNGLLPPHKRWRFPSLLRDLLLPGVGILDFPYYLLRDPRGLTIPFRIARAVHGFEPDVIHLQQTSDPRICLGLPLLRKYPLVLTVHDVIWQHGMRPRKRDFLRDLPTELSDELIVHGESLRELRLRGQPSFHPEHVHVIPHGVYSIYEKWTGEMTIETPNTVLFFGRMYPYKGLRTMIRIAQILQSSMPSARIVIAGTGPELTRLRPEIDRLANTTVYDQFIENELLARLFQEATIVALPYEEASQSGVVAIAYAFHKPVVVTRVGALPEVVEDGLTGFVTPAQNVDLFADALCNLLKDADLRSQMKHRIRSKCERELSWEAIATKTVKVYQYAIERKSHAM